MCTVTFLPAGDAVYLTSSRDEHPQRPAATPPLPLHHAGAALLAPRDGAAGGTWIAVNSRGQAGVLLNGALTAHRPAPPYRHSRGLVLPALLAAEDPITAFSNYPADGLEPFTLVLYATPYLYECRWNGLKKSLRALPADQPHIWSSATLYDPAVADLRSNWFAQWQASHPVPAWTDIRRFHQEAGDGDETCSLVMKRGTHIRTVSICSLKLQRTEASIHYQDLAEGKSYRAHSSLLRRPAQESRLRRALIRLRHWEYWPFHVLYAPIYPYWLWLCLKARSFFFFNTANPTIRNGGFLMESKKEIYDLLPKGSYPATLMVQKEKLPEAALLRLTEGRCFPLIAKPDIGMRGMSVQLLRSTGELLDYHRRSRVDYLLQDYIPYENELGIFYCRMPGSAQGTITGIVAKELVTVTGDGVHTIEELLLQDDRYVLQLPALRRHAPATLCEVPAAGAKRVLVPYGNHSRGARFLDYTARCTPQLLQVIDNLCRQIPGFHFGRLDIRYRSWEELCAGLHFSIIELNGAGSEPAHIYDPRHSIFFGWKEIIRHLNLLYAVSREGRKQTQQQPMSLREGLRMLKENSAYIKKIS